MRTIAILIAHMCESLRDVLVAFKGQRSEVAAAAEIGVSPNTLGNWIDGASFPRGLAAKALATALRRPMDEVQALIDQARAARDASQTVAQGA